MHHSSAHFSMFDIRSLNCSSLIESSSSFEAVSTGVGRLDLVFLEDDDGDEGAGGGDHDSAFGFGVSTKSYKPGSSAMNDSLHLGHLIVAPRSVLSISIVQAHSGQSIERVLMAITQ